MTAAGLIDAVERETGFRPTNAQVDRAAAEGYVSNERCGRWRRFDPDDVPNMIRFLQERSHSFHAAGNGIESDDQQHRHRSVAAGCESQRGVRSV
jgi:hypothetical protein